MHWLSSPTVRWDRGFFRKLLVVCLPIVIQNLMSASLHIIDGVMIAPYAAVTQAARYVFVYQLFLFGLASGCGIFFSQHWGTQDVKSMRRAMGLCFRGALVLAVLLNRKMRGRSIYRTIFFLPMVAAPAAVAMVWRWLFNSEFGLLNNVFHTDIKWVSDPKIAVYSIAVIGVWSIVGYNMVLFLSGLQEVPKDYYEAASIDGASGVRQFFSITIPLISPTLFFVCVTRVIGALQVFDLIYMVIEKGNPALQKTQSLVYLFYDAAFIDKNMGYGSAIVVFLLAVIMVLTVFQMIAQKKWVYYN